METTGVRGDCSVQIIAEDEVAGDTSATGRVEVDSETE